MNSNDLLHLAMELSDGNFAWHVFGTINAVAEGGYAPDNCEVMARKYLETFHADELREYDRNSQKTQKTLDATA